jgi:peptidoglycan/LPS O-acetylase OafA/YrhL
MGALTAVRFFAAFQVLLFHLWVMQALTWAPRWLQTLASAGFTGVTFFFVLSGFIFVYTYADKPLNLKDFWRARLARLYPVYLLGLLLTAPLFFSPDFAKNAPEQAWAVQHLGLTVTLVLTMMQAWIPGTAMGWNSVSWSVSVEVFFYSIFPWLMPRIRKFANPGLMLLGGTSWVISIAVAIIYVVFRPDGTSPDGTSFWLLALKFNPLSRLPEFLVGLACGSWFVRGQHSAKWATPLVLLGVAGTLGTIALSAAIPDPILATGLMAPAFAAVICGLALRPRWIAWLEQPWLVLLGEASYSLYLLHGLILIVTLFFIQPDPSGVVRPVRALLSTCAAILVSVLVFRFVDAPLRRRLRGQKPTKVVLSGA